MRLLLVMMMVIAAAGPAAADLEAPEKRPADTRRGMTAFLPTDVDVPSWRHGKMAVTYRVATRGDVESDLGHFRRVVEATLNDPAGWSRNGTVAFVPRGRAADFTILLASPDEVAAADPACSARYSCRVGDDVLINDARWRSRPEGYRGRSLTDYRRYVVNHEVGHWLGLDHEPCPRRGAPAPIMLQQSKGLEGCEATVWPLPQERRRALDNVLRR